MSGFESRFVEAICDQDGRNWKLLAPIQYTANDGTEYFAPKSSPTDGASTPAIIWSKLPPFGDYWLAAILHDSAYQNTLQLKDGTKAALQRDQCDELIREAMENSGVDDVTIEIIYDALRLFGQSSFNNDR